MNTNTSTTTLITIWTDDGIEHDRALRLNYDQTNAVSIICADDCRCKKEAP